MFAYVARQAIMNRDLAVHGYELFFRDGQQNSFPDIEPEQTASHLVSGSYLALQPEELSDGKIAHITFYQDTLLNYFPESLNNDSVVIEIIELIFVIKVYFIFNKLTSSAASEPLLAVPKPSSFLKSVIISLKSIRPIPFFFISSNS